MNHDLNEWLSERQRGYISNETLWVIGYTTAIVLGLMAIVWTH